MNCLIGWTKEDICIVLLDMSKAFVSMRHELMLCKLCKADVSESACAWFESYLSQREGEYRIRSLTRNGRDTSRTYHGPGVLNDHFRVTKNCEQLGFVDETKLSLGYPFSKLNDGLSAVNEDRKEISGCCYTKESSFLTYR